MDQGNLSDLISVGNLGDFPLFVITALLMVPRSGKRVPLTDLAGPEQPLYLLELGLYDALSFHQAHRGHQGDPFSGPGSHQESRDDGASEKAGRILPRGSGCESALDAREIISKWGHLRFVVCI